MFLDKLAQTNIFAIFHLLCIAYEPTFESVEIGEAELDEMHHIEEKLVVSFFFFACSKAWVDRHDMSLAIFLEEINQVN